MRGKSRKNRTGGPMVVERGGRSTKRAINGNRATITLPTLREERIKKKDKSAPKDPAPGKNARTGDYKEESR